MDANSFLKRVALFSLLSALPIFASASPPGGGGHSSGGGHAIGGGGGHAVGGGGHAVGGGGHAVGGGGHAVGGGGHAVGGGGHAVGGGGGHAVGGRSSAGTHANANTVRQGTVQVANSRSLPNDPSGRGDWKGGRGDGKHGHGNWKHGHRTAWHRGDDHNDKHDHHHHHRGYFGFSPYWYPSGGYYSYGYPNYSYDYYDYYYPENGYYSGQSESASIQVLVQDALARRGYYPGQVDGVIGPETRSAIREFQRDNGLPVTGQMNSHLIQALKIG
jgi:Putative peptidoglycan binding domain